MKRCHLFQLLAAPLLIIAGTLQAQVQLTELGAPFNLDLGANIPGVVNGPFTANTNSVGSGNPGPGDLNANGWHIYHDGSSTQAINDPAVFPSTLIEGQGLNQFPPLPSTGLHATIFNGTRAFGFQPSGSNFTSGAVTLRIQNLTGEVINSLNVAHDCIVFNDRDRSNSINLYYSTTNTANSYAVIPDAEVVSPGTADSNPQPVNYPVDVVIDGLNLLPNNYLYLRWVFEDVSGAGERDEFVMLNFSFTPESSDEVFVGSDNDFYELHQTLGETPLVQSTQIVGTNLSGSIVAEVAAPFQLSLDGDTFSSSVSLNPVEGEVNAPLYFRLNGGILGAYVAEVVLNSPGADEVEILLAGRIAPQLYINEFMATNSTTIADEFGEFDDWIEIYNPTASTISIDGYYLTDDLNNLTKYRIPEASTSATIDAGGWMLIWADNQSQQGDLHASFGLSANGEDVVLVGFDGLTIIDQYTYTSASADISEGRESDGAAEWVFFNAPTPNASNNLGTPFLSASPLALTGFMQELGSPSQAQSFTVNAQNLTGDITITVSAPFEVSLNETSGYSDEIDLNTTDGGIANATVWVRLNSSSEGEFSGQATVSSGATAALVNLNGVTAEDFESVPTLFINEFMAVNGGVIADEFGEFDDWIEIYNPNAFAVDLAGYYISDDLGNITRYQIPVESTEATIAPFGFLLIWADNQTEQGDLHTNFGLSSNGEDVVLTAPDGTTIVDQYTYTSATAGISEGRNGDGNPQWVFFETPTPNASNGPTVITEERATNMLIYPNPCQDVVIIESEASMVAISLFSIDGKRGLTIGCNSQKRVTLDLASLVSGMYIVQIETLEGTVTKRLAVR